MAPFDDPDPMTQPVMSRPRRVLAFLRNTWRGLTSMRTALMLLFLLAVAALPGALLPQYDLNPALVDQYYADHPTLAPVLDDLGFFDVFSTPWFAAIYLLLFISLVGCVAPRSLAYLRQLRSQPVATPRNLGRLPHHATGTVAGTPEQAMSATRDRLRRWRIAEREEPGGIRTISAEKGYLREAGNLVFHLALVGLLISFGVGKLYNYEGQVIVLADGSEFCNSGPYAYDSFKPGTEVDGTDLEPFCIQVDDFQARYSDRGQAEQFTADVRYQSGADLDNGTFRSTEIEVNHPLRLGDDRVYLLGNGYAPSFTVTFPNGEQRTGTIQWRPVDQGTLLSEGATKFDPPGITDDTERRTKQLAVTGLFAPTAFFDGTLLTSSFPEPRDPAVAIDVLRGDLGNNSGRGQSIFEIDESMVDSGRLVQVARENLRPGESLRLDDGTQVRFDGATPWVSLQVSHDPSQNWVLVFALLVLGGLGTSLSIKRRRFWIRATPVADSGSYARTVIELGGLARTEAAGYGEEFERIRADVLAESRTEPRLPVRTGER